MNHSIAFAVICSLIAGSAIGQEAPRERRSDRPRMQEREGGGERESRQGRPEMRHEQPQPQGEDLQGGRPPHATPESSEGRRMQRRERPEGAPQAEATRKERRRDGGRREHGMRGERAGRPQMRHGPRHPEMRGEIRPPMHSGPMHGRQEMMQRGPVGPRMGGGMRPPMHAGPMAGRGGMQHRGMMQDRMPAPKPQGPMGSHRGGTMQREPESRHGEMHERRGSSDSGRGNRHGRTRDRRI